MLHRPESRYTYIHMFPIVGMSEESGRRERKRELQSVSNIEILA
jgi:hypothetical protein